MRFNYYKFLLLEKKARYVERTKSWYIKLKNLCLVIYNYFYTLYQGYPKKHIIHLLAGILIGVLLLKSYYFVMYAGKKYKSKYYDPYSNMDDLCYLSLDLSNEAASSSIWLLKTLLADDYTDKDLIKLYKDIRKNNAKFQEQYNSLQDKYNSRIPQVGKK